MGKNTERFAEFIKIRKKPPPGLLYKYVPIETARLIIANETVRFRSPSDFNDPFDSQWNILWQLATTEFNQTLIERLLDNSLKIAQIKYEGQREWIIENRRVHNSLSETQKPAHIERMIQELGPEVIIPDIVRDQLKRLRIFCLAQKPDSIQMWSYYAAGHQGVAIAFASAVLEQHWEIPVEDVRYRPNLPELVIPESFFDYFIYGEEMPIIDHQRAANALTFTKADSWRHEEEWRYVSLANRGDTALYDDFNFPTSALAGLVAGCKCNRKEFKSLAYEMLAKNPDAKVFATARHPSQFDLVAIPIEG